MRLDLRPCGVPETTVKTWRIVVAQRQAKIRKVYIDVFLYIDLKQQHFSEQHVNLNLLQCPCFRASKNSAWDNLPTLENVDNELTDEIPRPVIDWLQTLIERFEKRSTITERNVLIKRKKKASTSSNESRGDYGSEIQFSSLDEKCPQWVEPQHVNVWSSLNDGRVRGFLLLAVVSVSMYIYRACA